MNAGSFILIFQVREYFLGTSMPIIKSAEVVRIECSTDEVKNIEVSCAASHCNEPVTSIQIEP